ncbi:hypothetical protein [Massilibacteroides sp.]|uniref:hypothetical protein n=1 Tax=Massilibacteroides sp. TaxID=2034766 RepID=UPI002636A21B|nr:hypothetical protein [Massilibacteroides sp.]MDD4515922.1 hypothetical protein [Massilibacteroides sp.]
MKKLKLLFCITTIVSLFSSCGVSTQYIGKSYSPTSNVDVFMIWEDVPGDYEVMGYVDATPIGLSGIEDAQKKVEEVARIKGADAIVFEGIQESYSNPTLETTEKREKNADGGYTKTTQTTETVQKISTLKVTFIKYRR